MTSDDTHHDEKKNNMARGARMFEDTRTSEGRARASQEQQHSSTSGGRELYDRLHPKKGTRA